MNEHDHQRVEKVGPWTFQRVMLLLNDYDGLSNLVVVPPDFIWIWVEIIDMPPALMAAATPKVVGKNLGFFLLVNQTGIHQGMSVSWGRCRDCVMMNHCGARCPREEEKDVVTKVTATPPPGHAIVFRGNLSTSL
ncbi:hypothetical protein ACLB2K_013456 [Fragaria x ananassa]